MSTVDISLLVIAVTFVILVLCLCRLICKTCTTLKKVNRVLDDLDQLHEMGVNINTKLKRLDPLFRAVENCGTEWECKTAEHSGMLFCKYCKAKFEEEEVAATDYIELALMGLNLWKKYKKG